MEEQIALMNTPSHKLENLYFYTNNNSLKVYLSKDSLVCNSQMESDNYDISLSNYINDGVIVTHLGASSEVIRYSLHDSNTMNPVVVSLNTDAENLVKIPAIIVGKDMSARLTNMGDYKTSDDLAACIVGHIPFSYVEKIFFESDEDIKAFQSMLQNVAYPVEIFTVGLKRFVMEDSPLDLNALKDTFDKFLESNEYNLQQLMDIVRRRDRIKGILSPAFNTNYDYKWVYRHNLDDTILNIGNIGITEAIGQLRREGYYINLSSSIPNYDPTPFKYIIEIFKNIFERESKPETEPKIFCNDLPDADEFELIGYSWAIENLITNDYKQFNSREWVEKFRKEFTKQIIALGGDKEKITRYEKKLENLFEIMNAKGKVKDFINSTELKSPLLNSVLLFAKLPSSTDSARLMDDMENFSINGHTRRLTWGLFGALNGTAYLPATLKNNAYVNRVCEEASLILTADDKLISDVPSFNTFSKYRDRKLFGVVTDTGFPIDITTIKNKEYSYKFLWLEVWPLLQSNKEYEQIVGEVLEKYKLVTPEYYEYRYTIMDLSNWSISIDNNMVLRSTQKITEERTFLLDKYINITENKFYNMYQDQPEKWESAKREFMGRLLDTSKEKNYE